MNEKQEGKTSKPDEASKEIKKPLDASDINETNEIKKDIYNNVKDFPVTVEEAYEAEEVKETGLAEIEKKSLMSTPIKDINTLGGISNLAQSLWGAKMLPYKTVQDAVIALMAGKELNLGLAATLGGIFPIEGKPTLGVHVKKGILLQNNIIIKRTHDMEHYYEYVDIIDGEPPSVIGYGFLSDLPKYKDIATGIVKKKHIDTRTQYILTRYFKTPKGVIKNTATGIFGIADAKQAGLLEKSNWKNYTRDMLSSRAFSRAANEIADDLLQGMLSFSEMADINDSVTYYVDDNGHEQIVK